MDKKSGQVVVSKRVLFFAIVLTMVVSFILGTRSYEFQNSLAALVGIKTSNETIDTRGLQEVYQRLKANYDGDINTQALLEGANHGLVNAVGDKYTTYLTQKEAEELDKDLRGDIGAGIGAEITQRAGQPTIARILPDNPAGAAGLKAGDVIVGINDVSADGWDAEKAANAIRGEDGTTVELVVRRGKETKTFNITRAIVDNPSVYSEVKSGVGILTISRFDEETGALARKAAEEFVSRNVKGVIIDVRSDGGGYMDAAIDVASLWLKKTDIVVSQRERGSTSNTMYANGNAVLADTPTILLMNGGTASASEIVAAALHDHGKAKLFGEKTFGKGSVQQIIKLSGGSALRVTISHWYTPNNQNVGGKGITPDKKIELTEKDANAGRDPQLAAAIKELTGK